MEQERLIYHERSRRVRRIERLVFTVLLAAGAVGYSASGAVRAVVHSPGRLVQALWTGIELKELEGVATAYRREHDGYPSTAAFHDLVARLYPPTGPERLHPRLTDWWGRPYQFTHLAPDGFRFACLGPDGLLGTDDDLLLTERE